MGEGERRKTEIREEIDNCISNVAFRFQLKSGDITVFQQIIIENFERFLVDYVEQNQ